MKILLDTCAFLWLIKGETQHLSQAAVTQILDPENEVFLSTISIWEILLKNKLNKLPLPEPVYGFVIQQREAHQIASLEVQETDLEVFSKLPDHHRDPFDRILICQAIQRQLRIMTTDTMIKQYPVPILN